MEFRNLGDFQNVLKQSFLLWFEVEAQFLGALLRFSQAGIPSWLFLKYIMKFHNMTGSSNQLPNYVAWEVSSSLNKKSRQFPYFLNMCSDKPPPKRCLAFWWKKKWFVQDPWQQPCFINTISFYENILPIAFFCQRILIVNLWRLRNIVICGC